MRFKDIGDVLMGMTLFDDLFRSDKGPAAYSDPQFTYLNRSARSDVAAIRAVLEEWAARYPSEHRAEMISRFRSTNRWQHLSAAFELFLHELLLQLGCRVAVHAQTSTSRRPDFHVTDPDDRHAFLEATLVTGESKAEQGARARLQTVYDVINQVDSPNFFIGVAVTQASERPLPGRRLKTYLAKCLQNEDPDLSIERRWSFTAEGWDIQLTATPKSRVSRGKPGVRALGYKFIGMQEIDAWTPLREAIKGKASRYGELDAPYVVALNLVAEWPPDEIDIPQALFGQEVFTFGSSQEPGFSRKLNGAWLGPHGPQNTRNSAVLLVDGLSPWTLASATATLYHHPWAQRPYDGTLTRFRSVVAEGNQLVSHDGEPLHRLIGLPEQWPGPRDIQR